MGFQSCSKPPQGGLFLLECVPHQVDYGGILRSRYQGVSFKLGSECSRGSRRSAVSEVLCHGRML